MGYWLIVRVKGGILPEEPFCYPYDAMEKAERVLKRIQAALPSHKFQIMEIESRSDVQFCKFCRSQFFVNRQGGICPVCNFSQQVNATPQKEKVAREIRAALEQAHSVVSDDSETLKMDLN